MKCPRCQQETLSGVDSFPERRARLAPCGQPRDRQRPDPQYGSGLVPVVSRNTPRFERQAADASERNACEG